MRFVEFPETPVIVPAFLVVEVTGPVDEDPAYQGEVLRPGGLTEMVPLLRTEVSRLLWTPQKFRLFLFDYLLPLQNADKKSRGIDRMRCDFHRAYGLHITTNDDLVVQPTHNHFDLIYDGIVGRTAAVLPIAMIELPYEELHEEYDDLQGRVQGESFYGDVNPRIGQLLARGFGFGVVQPRVIGVCNAEGLQDLCDEEHLKRTENIDSDDE